MPGKAPSSVCAQFSSPLEAAELTSNHRSPSFDLLLHLLPYCCSCCWSVRRGGRSSSCSSGPPTTLPSHPISRTPHVWCVNSISWESQLPNLQGTHPSHFLSLDNKRLHPTTHPKSRHADIYSNSSVQENLPGGAGLTRWRNRASGGTVRNWRNRASVTDQATGSCYSQPAQM